jgi:hypothetical protein
MLKNPFNVDDFDTWFSGSKVTNPNGSPLVAFHGTQAAFQNFETPAWFTPSEFHADNFSADWGDQGERTPESRVIPVYLAFKNPLYTNDWGMTEPSNIVEWLADLKGRGYDSVIFSCEGEVELIALDASQILPASHPLAPDGEFKNYKGTDEGRKFKDQPRHINKLNFIKSSPWTELDGGVLVRYVDGTQPDDEDNHLAVIDTTARVLHNSEWVTLAVALDTSPSLAMTLCDESLRSQGVVLEPVTLPQNRFRP